MPSVDLGSLTSSHAERLRWFVTRALTTTAFPAPLAGDLYLSSKPKGIFKPRDLRYALSIRINLDSRYPDGDVYEREDGTWYFAYHQENPDASQRDREFTNVGLMRCVKDRVPVGVLRERVPDRANKDKYDVLGIAVPAGWADGYFMFEGVREDGFWAKGSTAADVLISDAENIAEDHAGAVPTDDYDARRRVTRQIVARRGQKGFRAALFAAYDGACAVTGTAAAVVLEAAHIRPYRGPESDVVNNGLLLRADIHTLFDLGMLAINPQTRTIAVSAELAGTPYEELGGKALREPSNPLQAASVEALESAWTYFGAQAG